MLIILKSSCPCLSSAWIRIPLKRGSSREHDRIINAECVLVKSTCIVKTLRKTGRFLVTERKIEALVETKEALDRGEQPFGFVEAGLGGAFRSSGEISLPL